MDHFKAATILLPVGGQHTQLPKTLMPGLE